MARIGCSLLAATQPKYLSKQRLGKTGLNVPVHARGKPQLQRAAHSATLFVPTQQTALLHTAGCASDLARAILTRSVCIFAQGAKGERYTMYAAPLACQNPYLRIYGF